MNAEQAVSKNTSSRTFKAQLKDKVRKAEILGWYLCYKIVAGSKKENPAKSLNS